MELPERLREMGYRSGCGECHHDRDSGDTSEQDQPCLVETVHGHVDVDPQDMGVPEDGPGVSRYGDHSASEDEDDERLAQGERYHERYLEIGGICHEDQSDRQSDERDQ